MSKADVIQNVEAAINRVCTDIKNKKGGSGADKLDSLSKLINAYNRLIDTRAEEERDKMEYGDPDHITRIEERNRKKMEERRHAPLPKSQQGGVPN
jgi:hypothetical protein